MNRKLLNELIEQIVTEVVRRVRIAQRKLASPEETVVLTASPVAFPERLKAWLDANCAENYVLIHLGAGAPWEAADVLDGSVLGEEALARKLYKAKRVLLACPPVGLLRQIGSGDDRSDAARLFTKAILWQKKTAVLLDYEPPRFHRNSFLGSLSDALDALRDSGVEIANYCGGEASADELCTLVTEATVQKAHAAGRPVLCAQRAIITPAAKDAAKALNVDIEYG